MAYRFLSGLEEIFKRASGRKKRGNKETVRIKIVKDWPYVTGKRECFIKETRTEPKNLYKKPGYSRTHRKYTPKTGTMDRHRKMEYLKYIIRTVLPDDGEEIAQIYNHYITETIITFEEEAVTGDIIRERINEVQSARLPWFVAEQDGNILGYCYAGKWKGRCAYRFSTEVTVYLRPDLAGNGIGSSLYGKLLPVLKAQGIHAAVGGIALPNEASIGLHEKMGFLKAAHFKEVGFKFNRWIDVGYWQLIL